MTTDHVDLSLSQLSLQSANSTGDEDWDHSMHLQSESTSEPIRRTPRNSVAFPGHATDSGEGKGDGNDTIGLTHAQSARGGKAKWTLSELLKLHAANGPGGLLSPEEANRVADVLRQWINSASSPYESEDDFFTRTQSQDDSSIATTRSPSTSSFDSHGRSRRQSESNVGQS